MQTTCVHKAVKDFTSGLKTVVESIFCHHIANMLSGAQTHNSQSKGSMNELLQNVSGQVTTKEYVIPL